MSGCYAGHPPLFSVPLALGCWEVKHQFAVENCQKLLTIGSSEQELAGSGSEGLLGNGGRKTLRSVEGGLFRSWFCQRPASQKIWGSLRQCYDNKGMITSDRSGGSWICCGTCPLGKVLHLQFLALEYMSWNAMNSSSYSCTCSGMAAGSKW